MTPADARRPDSIHHSTTARHEGEGDHDHHHGTHREGPPRTPATARPRPAHRNVYALLVGIDDYPSPVPALSGCRNDIEAIEALLTARVTGTEHSLHVRSLTDEQATRAAVIAGFREHLGAGRRG